MPRLPTTYQFDLFSTPNDANTVQTPQWQALPAETRQSVTELMVSLILDHGSERKRHAAEIARYGRMTWQRRHGYGKRSLAETAFSRIKTINDGRLTSRTFGSQQNEIVVHIKIANRNMLIARPMSERVR